MTKILRILTAYITQGRRVLRAYTADVRRVWDDYRQAVGQTAVTVCLVGVGGWLVIAALTPPTPFVVREKVACIVGPTDILQHTSLDGAVIEAVKRVTAGCDNGWYFTSRDDGGRFGLDAADWDRLRQGVVIVATHQQQPAGTFTRTRNFLTAGSVWDILLPRPRPHKLDDSSG